MIFINANFENYVQINDKTRIDVSKTFSQSVSITDITIKPSATDTAVSVYNSGDTSLWFLDWAYTSAATNTVTIVATDSGATTYTKELTIESVTEATDYLYSNDRDIFKIETELKDYIPDGYSSFNYVHREAQQRILDFINRKNLRNRDDTRFLKTQLNLDQDIRRWSTYEALQIIYSDLFVTGGDKFAIKADTYTKERDKLRTQNALRIDYNKDGTIEPGETVNIRTTQLVKHF